MEEINSLCNLEEDIQTLVVLPLLRQAALSHPILQVLFPTQLHLDVEVNLDTGGGSNQFRKVKQASAFIEIHFPEKKMCIAVEVKTLK